MYILRAQQRGSALSFVLCFFDAQNRKRASLLEPWHMKTLHIVPGDSAGGSLVQALRDAGRDDDVLRFLDDLSCGPIDPDEPSTRAAWWEPFGYDTAETAAHLRKFWQRAAATDYQLVVWFGRHSARELAFFLAWIHRLQDRPYQIIDVTGRLLPVKKPDGSTVLSKPAQAVSRIQSDSLRLLLDQEQPITAQEKYEGRKCWERLCSENAHFRVITENGLVSAPIDHFDLLLLAQATREWQTISRVEATTFFLNSEPYQQVHDVMLHARLVALVDQGRLLADGDPWDRSCRVRLPAKLDELDH
jgi:Protein of unknown function/Domain of unknown function (DUF1835)